MRILFVSTLDITSKNNTGGHIVARRNYDALCSIYGNKNIDLCVSSCKNKHEKNIFYLKSLSGNYKNRILHPFQISQKFSHNDCKRIREIVNSIDYDIVWLESSVLGMIGKYCAKKCKNVKIFVFMQNIEKNLMWRTWKKSHFWNAGLYNAIKIIEKNAIRYSDKVLSLNKRDSMEILHLYKKKSDMIFPVTLKDTFCESEYIDYEIIQEQYILFTGSYFAPNNEAVKWMADNIADKINCKIYVIGKGMECLRNKINSNNINIIGTVESTAPYYKNAIGVIEPIFSGSGMKVKTAEALMYGKSIIATNEALTGYYYDDSHDIFCCNNAEEFIESIKTVITNNKIFHKNNRSLFLERYCIDAYITELKKVCENE